VASTFSETAAAFGIGVALAAAPGSVQAVIVSESMRGGVARGSRALLGVHATFGAAMLALALGLTVATPAGWVLRILSAVGGLWLLWLAVDGVRSSAPGDAGARGGLAPEVRGALAIVLNPGAWIFLAAVASPLLAGAADDEGPATAALVAVALVVGAALGDLALVLFAGLGLRRADERVGRAVRLGLAVVLAGLGVWLLVRAI
jgi:threonine/homoserine/homoserine lactone efflux protein